MKKRVIGAALASALVAGAIVALAGSATTAGALNYGRLRPIQRHLLSGFATSELTGTGSLTTTPASGLLRPNPNAPNYFPLGLGDCSQTLGSNVKVNQNCLNLTDADLQGRAQAQNETSIAQDPSQPTHLVASYNDYRRGDGTCGASYSIDGGHQWRDTTVPNGFTRGTAFGSARQYWQAGGDTSVAWDTKGNAYLSCQVFMRGAPPSTNPDTSSAFYVFRSTQNHGASWNFPGRPVTEFTDVAGSGLVLEDKQLLTVDNHPGSPFQDRVYVSWTEFAADGSAYIWEAYSADYGQTFGPRHLVSKTSPLCTNTQGQGSPNGPCNENQFSQPFTGRDGTLYITFANFNSQAISPGEGGGEAPVKPADNHFQILLVKSVDGGNTFSAPVKVSDYYDLPDCPTYQAGLDPQRACVPEKGATTNSIFRAANYPVGAVNPGNPRQVAVTFGSYINSHSNEANGCVPAGLVYPGDALYQGVKTPGACNNDILISVSNDGGATFTGTNTDPRKLTSVTQDPAQATSDQWFQWADFTRTGTLAVSYYDRQYGNDETTGYSDFSLSGSRNLATFASQRVTGSSMPSPTEFGGVFFGDYTGLTALDTAHPLWPDVRNPDLFVCPGTGTPTTAPAVCTGPASNAPIANDQDVFTDTRGVPVG